MNFTELTKLAVNLSSGKALKPINFSMEDGSTLTVEPETMEEVLREELFNKCSDRKGFERYKLDLFELIEESIDANLPPKLEAFYRGWATTRQYGINDRPVFKINDRRATINRGKTFITQVTSAGTYEVFRLSAQNEFTVHFTAIGGAIQVQFEEFITGRLSWAELLSVIEEGMEDRINEMVLAALNKVEANLPAANKASGATFDDATRKAFEKVLDTVGVYGSPSILCTAVFAREITEGTDWASEEEKRARRNVGYLAQYKGAPIVILPQSFEDEKNTVKVVDDSKAYVFPAGRTSLINICYQGPTQVRDIQHDGDWSYELQTYKRVGVNVVALNDIGTLELTSLKA